MSNFKDEVEDIERENHYKAIADKIRQTLSRIRQDPASSAKRWVWELVQNAKDTPNRWGKVSIEIELTTDRRLLFKHNGDPFTLRNVMGLIEQVSSKDSMNEEGQTGKFGTGFICTHLLSDIIQIDGIVIDKDGNHRKFNLNLDRSGCSSEELIPRIKNTSRQFKNLGADSIICNYENERSERKFDTLFTYYLTSEEKLSAAEKGIEDLTNTLPVTLITQREKIKQVRVINHILNTNVLYVCETIPIDDNVIISTISNNECKKYYLSYHDNEVMLTTEVTDDNSFSLVKRDSSQPVLYRDFPLIGSERFYFPYTLNGYNFFPTDERDGLTLNTLDSSEACANREIVSHAVDAVISFNQWLVKRNASCRFNMAASQKPKPLKEYDETVAGPWINNLQNCWRMQLLEQHLAEIAGGEPRPLKEYRIPWFIESKSLREQFYDIVSACWLGEGVLPKREHLIEWIEVIKPQFESWNCPTLKYEIDNLLEDLQKQSNLHVLEQNSGKSRMELNDWLNQMYAFMKDNDLIGKLREYAVIPNQRGEFKKLDDLRTDYHSVIPVLLKEIYNLTVDEGNEIEVNLVDNAINCESFGNEIGIYGQKEIVEELNANLGKNSYDILSLFPTDASEKERQHREELYSLCSSYHQMRPFSSVAIDNDVDLWRKAEDYWFNNSPKAIEGCGSIDKMSSGFFIEPHSSEECLQWLDKYISFYRINGKSDIVEKFSVFPNQKHVLCNISNLHFDKDIEEAYKDLDEAANIGMNIKSYRDILLSRSISGYESHDPNTVKDVYETVRNNYNEGNDGKKEEISALIISLIPEDKDENDAYKRFYDFVYRIIPNVPERKSVTTSSGFDWTFVQEHFIKKICRNVAETVNVKKLVDSSYNFSDEQEAIEWVDSFIEFLHSFRSKKFWSVISDKEEGIGIWINQNGNFCKFQDVHKDDSINDELKDLALNRHVNKDFREELFHKDSFCETFLETNPLNNMDISEVIDNAIRQYDEDGLNKQDPEFTKLIFSLNKLTKEVPNLALNYFSQKKPSLIVGSLGEGDTMNIVGTLIQKGDDFLQLISKITSRCSESMLNRILEGLEAVVDDEKFANLEEGNYGEEIVWQDLQRKYPLIEGYNIIWASRDNGEPRYDFRIEKYDKIICYYDAKTTSRGIDNADSIPFFMRKSQWLFLENLSEDTPYFIARVFLENNNQIRYIRVSSER